MEIPEACIIGCNSMGSNTGTLVALAIYSISKMMKGKIGVCSLPAIINQLPRQLYIVKNRVKKIIVIDGCRRKCVKNLLEKIGIRIDLYINIEEELGIRKKGPFTTHDYSSDELRKVVEHILYRIKEAHYI